MNNHNMRRILKTPTLRMLDGSPGKRPIMDAKRVRELLNYDPATGVLTWKTVDRNHKAGPVGVVTSRGYIRVGVEHRLYPAHHLVWAWVHGAWPQGQLDHINQNKADNRLTNLREVDAFANCQNVGVSSRNTSGFKGVCRVQGKWRAMIAYGGKDSGRGRKNVFLGLFDDINDAARAYALAAAKYHTHNPAAQTAA